jgi:hypothetical protein
MKQQAGVVHHHPGSAHHRHGPGDDEDRHVVVEFGKEEVPGAEGQEPHRGQEQAGNCIGNAVAHMQPAQARYEADDDEGEACPEESPLQGEQARDGHEDTKAEHDDGSPGELAPATLP